MAINSGSFARKKVGQMGVTMIADMVKIKGARPFGKAARVIPITAKESVDVESLGLLA
jgi:hypothetical protein